MADIQSQLPVKLTDNTNTVAVTAGSALKVDGSSVTQPVTGTLSLVPSGTQAVSGTVTAVTNADINVAAGTASSKALLSGGVYNSATPTLTNGQTIALQTDVNGSLKVAGTFTATPTGTQAVSGTVTNVPSGTQNVTGTVTLSSQTVTIGATSVTQPVSGTVTLSSNTVTLNSSTVTSVTNADINVGAGSASAKALLGGLVYNSTLPTMTAGQTVALQGDVNGALKVTQLQSTGIVASYATSAALANSSTATLTYTVTTGKTLYWKGIHAASSGGPCKVIIDYGSGPTVVAVGFYSPSVPYFHLSFDQPIAVASGEVCNIKIQNNAGAAQDVYATHFGLECAS